MSQITEPDNSTTTARSATTSQQLITSGVMGLLAYIIPIPILLFVAPYIIQTLGVEKYGVWAVMNLLVSYTGFAEFGLRIPLVKYVAESYALQDTEEINRLINTVLSMYLVLSGIIALLLMLNLDWIIANFFRGQEATPHLPHMLFGVLFAFIVHLAFSVLPALLSGIQRVDQAMLTTLVNQILGAGGTFVVLALGWGLEGLVGSYVFVTILITLLQWIIARRLFPALRLNPFDFCRHTFRRLFAFSTRVQVATIAGFADNNLNRTLLAYFLTPIDVAHFQVGIRIWKMVGVLPLALVRPIIPAASDLAALGHTERLRQLYFRSLKYISIVGFPLFACTMVLIHPFIHIWLGEDFDRSAWAVAIVLGSFFVWITTGSGSTILHGLGKPEYEMRRALLHLALSVGTGITLTLLFGYYGAVFSQALTMTISHAYLHVVIRRELSVGFIETLQRSVGRPFMASGVAAALALLARGALPSPNIWLIMLLGCLYMLTYAVVLLLAGGLDAYDRRLLADWLKQPLRYVPLLDRLARRL